MNVKEIQKNLTKYASYMEEIKRRTAIAKNIIDLTRSGKSFTGDPESDIDFVYLQVRKITELVMFACIVGRKTAGDRMSKILRKGYEIAKLKRELASLDIDYFPTPKYDKNIDNNSIRCIGNLEDKNVSFASDSDLLSAYGRAGNYLHAQRDSKYGDNTTKIKLMDRAAEELNNIVNLLNHHWVKITDRYQFAVVMQGIKEDKVQVTLLEMQ